MASPARDDIAIHAAATAAGGCDDDAGGASGPHVHDEQEFAGDAEQLQMVHAWDPAELCGDITRCADSGDEQQLEQLLRFLQQDAEPLVMEQVALGLIALVEASGAVEESVGETTLVFVLFLDQLLGNVKLRARTESGGQHSFDTLLAFFRLATKRLSSNPLEEQERAMFLQWCDHVLELVYTDSPNDTTTNAGSEGNSSSDAREPSDHHKRIVSIASMLLALHDTIAEREAAPTAANFKVVTLVWKNLTKMSSTFAHILAANASESATSVEPETNSSATAFQVDDMLASVIASMEKCALQLCGACDGLSEANIVATLKFLRLYWRAFQGQLLCYMTVLTSEVESSIMALVNVAASLAELSQAQHANAIPKKIQVEALRLLNMVVMLAEKLGAADADSISASTREQVRVLLWHSDDDVVRAITQRRCGDSLLDRQTDKGRQRQTESSIRIGHLLVVAAFGSADDNILPAEDPSEEIGGAKILAAGAMLLERYQTSALHVPWNTLKESSELFLDSFLNLLLRVDDIEALQLFLVKQLFHPDPSRRFIMWEVWKEFICFGWDEERAGAVLTTLIAIAQCEGGPTTLAPGVQQEVFELIAFLYPEMPDSLKRLCIDEATEVVDAIFSEGPSHKFTLKVASQLNLLEKLSSVSFLKNYDHPDKEEWIAKYLPMCFECCGTVLDLLNSSTNLKQEEKHGMMRILDVCLLVVKAILDDNDPQSPDFGELARMLVPMSSEILTQLSKINPRAVAMGLGRSHSKTPTTLDFKLEREASHTLSRILETSTHLLGKLGNTLKRNQSNQFVFALRDLSQVLEQAQPHDVSGAIVIVAWFAKNTLFDVQVVDGDMEVAWQLFMRLFRNLSSLLNSKGDSGTLLSPHLSTTFDAFYEFLAHSNTVKHQQTHPSLSVANMLHESAKALFSDFLALKQISKVDAESACRAEMSSSYRAQVRVRHERLYCERFPDEKGGSQLGDSADADPGNLKHGHESTEAPSSEAFASNSRESDGERSRKRQKLDAFVSMCKRSHQALSSSSAQTTSAALLSVVTEQELDEATHVLEQLLARAYC